MDFPVQMCFVGERGNDDKALFSLGSQWKPLNGLFPMKVHYNPQPPNAGLTSQFPVMRNAYHLFSPAMIEKIREPQPG